MTRRNPGGEQGCRTCANPSSFLTLSAWVHMPNRLTDVLKSKAIGRFFVMIPVQSSST
jgi:hypothetical protein